MPPMRSVAACSRPSGLYVHVPFCVRKCAYCAFFSRQSTPDLVAAWHTGLERELGALPDGFAPESIFFGGGTPTALEDSDLAHLLELIHSRINLEKMVEWTCEVNPGTLAPAKAARLREAGVNRFSIGAQSFDATTLTRLGRIHTAIETHECLVLSRQAGVKNLGLDLIYGVPGVPFESFQKDVETVMALNPEHLSCYCLEIEEGTPFARQAKAGRLVVSEEAQREQFNWARCRLSEAGWTHYEISNFAKPGFECRQNLLYWTGGDYIGLGPAAHSHWEGARWGNTADLPMWTRAFEERLAPEAKACETLVMGLRRLAGWGRTEFFDATGFDYDELRGEEIRSLVDKGMLVAESHRIRLAEDALFISNFVFAELV